MSNVRVKRNGECPYCVGTSFTDIDDSRPQRTVRQCGDCQGHFVHHDNGSNYPLEDRSDPASPPGVIAPAA